MTLPVFVLHGLDLVAIPLLLAGMVRKIKAGMQGRIGAPLSQPVHDLIKLVRKGETISDTASWVFIAAPRTTLAVALTAALVVPWSGAPPTLGGSASDLLLVAYLLGLGKFAAMLAAMDTGSAFGGLGASREATLNVIAEPILLLALGALAIPAGSLDLARVMSAPAHPVVALLAGLAMAVASLIELSRMPVDDPTTHLELTMVHEALILENSGRSLAMVETAAALRACVYLGLATQTLLRVWSGYSGLSIGVRYGVGIAALLGAAALMAVAEGVLVKLNWHRVPNFAAFGLALSLLAALVAAAHG